MMSGKCSHDGEIHYSEFIAAMLQSTIKITKEIVRETFDLFDVSRTGRITCSDLERVLGASIYIYIYIYDTY